MSLTSEYLEFNSDLFLCNTIKNVKDLDNNMPILGTNNSLYHLDIRDISPFIDPNWKIYTSSKKLEKMSYTAGLTSSSANPKHTFSNSDNSIIQQMSTITYSDFINNYDTYLKNGTFIYSGNGQIDPPPSISKTTYQLSNGLINLVDFNLIGSCTNYTLTSNCNNGDSKQTCEICKNFKYRDWYKENITKMQGTDVGYKDSTAEYHHTWILTWNLGIGIIGLMVGIYFQLKK